jgi:toxin ParE1/3/4
VPLKVCKQHRARVDLLEIWLYTAERWSAEQADHYLDELERAMQRLGEKPSLGTDAGDVRPGYRRLMAGKHRVFYVVAARRIDIVRVLHPRMDVEAELDE